MGSTEYAKRVDYRNLTRSTGAQRTKDAQEVLVARQQIVLMCKAFKVQPIDMVYIDYKGEELASMTAM